MQILGLTLGLLIQKLWGQGPEICILLSSPGGSDKIGE